MNLSRVTSDDDNAGPPRPLVMGSYVYYWTLWRGVLVDAVYTPRFAQFIVQLPDGNDLVVKDPEYRHPNDTEVLAGHELEVIGLGDRTQGSTFYYCGLLDITSGAIRHLGCWLQHIDWSRANQYFGWRTSREAKDAVLAYYAAVFEVLARSCYGPLGTGFEQHVVPAAEKEMKSWKIRF